MANSHQSAGDGIVSDSAMQAGSPSQRVGRACVSGIRRPAGPSGASARGLHFANTAGSQQLTDSQLLDRVTVSLIKIQGLADIMLGALAASDESLRRLYETSLADTLDLLHELACDAITIACDRVPAPAAEGSTAAQGGVQ